MTATSAEVNEVKNCENSGIKGELNCRKIVNADELKSVMTCHQINVLQLRIKGAVSLLSQEGADTNFLETKIHSSRYISANTSSAMSSQRKDVAL